LITVPGFLLRRLYVRGSLRNTADGFAFQLRNTLGSGYANEMFPLTLDGRELALDRSTFSTEGGGDPVAFSAVSAENPFTLQMNKTVTIAVAGETLPAGTCKVGMAFLVRGVGRLGFDFSDNVA
jgi:hypothetical protein